jgi:acyl-CoA synthetase (NDP forming)
MNYLNLTESIDFLEKNKIKCIDTFIVTSKSALLKYTDFPYCLKLSSSILHKSDEHAVITTICNKEKLVESYKYLKNLLNKHKISGNIVLQKQVSGLELIIGIIEDPQFGKTLLFGSGGIFTEQISDAGIKLIPIKKEEVSDLIKNTNVYSILKGARGKKYNIKLLEQLLFNISKLAISKDIKDLDLNPVIINEDGLFIVDARVGL